MKHVSLFTGIGGFDLAGDRAGMETVGQVEIDRFCRSVLERHWPDVPRWEDVTDVGATDFAPYDVLTGGFPCQDISVAGRRAGLAGDRSGLWYEFARIIAESSPRWVVIENVPGLLSSGRGRDMGAILGTLADYGYGFAYRVLDAQWFGVAQRRRRVFIVGHLGGDGASKVLALGQGSAGDSAPRRTEREGVAVAVAGRPDLSSSAAGTTGQRGNRGHSELDGHGAHVVGWDEGGGGESWREADPMGTLGTGTAGTRHMGHLVTYVASPTAVRRLTPVECARLQGFPDDWNDHLSDTQRYRQFGNAVCVNVAEWLMKRIAAHG